MSRKLTVEEVRDKFKKKNRELLETTYSRNTQRLRYRCLNCKNEDTCSIVGLSGFRSGCKKCNHSVKERSYTQEEIEEIYRKQGCEFQDVFKTTRQKHQYKCSCGARHKASVDHFLRGCRCDQCGNVKISESICQKEEPIKKTCQENGCQLIDFWLQECGVNGKRRIRIKFKCKCNKIKEAWWTNFRRFPNCKECGNKKISGPSCHMWNPNRESVRRRKQIQKRCYNLVKRTLLAFNKTKKDHKSKILGYTVQQLYNRIYLEHPQFNFNQKWDIDHIFPVQAFVDHDIDDMKIINNLSNLRPLEEKENLEKADKYDKDKFLLWLEYYYKNYKK